MKFLVAYSAFSLFAAAIASALPARQDLTADGYNKKSSSSLISRLSRRDDDDPSESKEDEKPKEEEAAPAPAPKSKGEMPKGKGEMPKGKGSPPKGKGDMPKGKGDMPKGKGDAPKGKGGGGKGPSILGGGTRCGPVAVLFSRGTFEVGAQGMAVGSPFTTALQAVLPSGTVFWGNEYFNDVVGYLTGGSIQGSTQMRNKAQEFVDKCSGIKLVLGGYSQGAQVTHHALESANAKTKAAVKAVVLFGDPLSGRPIPGIPRDRVKTYCAAGDTICWGLPVVTIAHMAYGVTDSAAAAAWVRTKINS